MTLPNMGRESLNFKFFFVVLDSSSINIKSKKRANIHQNRLFVDFYCYFRCLLSCVKFETKSELIYPY